MILRKIRMINFRAFRNKTINFQDKAVVLLSAANGMGKTTTIDAIEWCLTGGIGRLKASFDYRSTNSNDRKMNTGGILKHRDAAVNDKVIVKLFLLDGEKEIILCREQEKDELQAESSKVTLNGNEKDAKIFIRDYVSESFYNFHFCDVQKSFAIQSKKRRDLKDLFDEFITNYDDQKKIADNINIFVDDVERNIECRTSQKEAYDKEIEDYNKRIDEAHKEINQTMYPQILFYQGEKTDITYLDRDELITQKAEIENCGYLAAKEKLSILIKNESIKYQQGIIKNIASYLDKKGNLIQDSLKIGLFKNEDAIKELETKLEKLRRIKLSKENVIQNGSLVASAKDSYTKAFFDEDTASIREKEKRLEQLSLEIDLLSQNNRVLKLLSYLTANKQEILEYRDENIKENEIVRCPVCGSESFAYLEENSILKEANDYIKKNGEAVKRKETEKTELQSELDELYIKVIGAVKTIAENEKSRLENEVNKLYTLKDEMRPYFDEVRKLQESGSTIDIDEITEEKVKMLLLDVEKNLLEEENENRLRTDYQNILKVLGYEFEHEPLQQTCAKVENRIVKSNDLIHFTYDVFVRKLNAIDSALANKTISDLKKELEKCNKKNKDIDEEIGEYKKLKDVALQKADSIRQIVNKLSRDEYAKLGPALCKYYNKLYRFNSQDGINIIQEDDGISLRDDKDKNIVNILSNGQISIFMLALFFAGIVQRNDSEKMKIYFIDDLTACMDDVNMLAFMDLLKYQLSSKATMEQLFFITCDERISRLLKYKLQGRGIEMCELAEKDFC